MDPAQLIAPVSFFGASAEVVAHSAHGLANAADTRSGTSGSIHHDAESEVVDVSGRDVTIALNGTSLPVRIPARGVHYAVDAAAAVSVAHHVLGDEFDSAAVSAGFAQMAPAYGRGELVPLRQDPSGEQVEFVMFKNGPSLQLNLDALDGAPERILMAIDEGTPDVSWLYDVDLSALRHIDVVTGEKAHQIALRLAYAGISVGVVEPDMSRAVELMRAFPETADLRQLWFVNYELMMHGRRLLRHGDQEVARR